MDDRIRALALKLLEHGVDRLSARDRRVIASLAGRRSLVRDATAEYEAQMTPGQRAADVIARWGGSWAFVGFFAGFWPSGVAGTPSFPAGTPSTHIPSSSST